MRRLRSGGGWAAMAYAWRKAREVGVWRMWRALRSKNACKTCALGMGGQKGGMVNEAGRFPEVCKKSLQAMAADMQGAIRADFWSTYSIAQLRQFSPRELESCGRLVQPVLYERGQDYYRVIDWPDALQRICRRLRTLPADESFWYFSGRSSNEAGFLLQLMARLYGTNNVNNCSYYCHQASGVGLSSSLGSGTATLVLEDLDHADTVFVIGGNPASNHPRLMTTLMHVRRRGGQVIVINPVRETGLLRFRVPSNLRSLLFGDEIASLYVQPHIGGDLALLTGVAKHIDELGASVESFLQNHCDGYDAWRDHLRSLSWEELVEKSGVDAEQMREIARRYAKSRNAVFSWTMGITHHAHGVSNVQAIANLALMRAMVGRPHAGLLPIRGHSNVQGIGSMGVTPQLKEIVFQRLQQQFQVKLPTSPGRDTLACIEGAYERQLRFGFCLGGNLFGSNPDSRYADEALSRLDMLVQLNTTLNTGHAHGLAGETLILPVLARDEEPQATTQESMFNYVRLSDGGPSRHAGPRSEVEVIAAIADAVLGSGGAVDWQSMVDTRQIRQAIARIVPGFERLADVDRTRAEFQIPGRTFHRPVFATPSGRAQLHVHRLPPLPAAFSESAPQAATPTAAATPATVTPATAHGGLRLMTVRSEGQFNTVVYEDEDIYRGQERRDVILLHPDDMSRLKLTQDQQVRVVSETGEMPNILAREFPRIRAGNALMYYPEANRLVARRVDSQSRTPAFKGMVVRVVPMEGAAT
jgi:molybdopterin-dependent oxidoreductase alpha subunit